VLSSQRDKLVSRKKTWHCPWLFSLDALYIRVTLQEVLDDRRFACEQAPAVEGALQKARLKGDFSDHLIASAACAANAQPVQTFDTALRKFPEFEVHRAGAAGRKKVE
jgi:hypothetical protein